MGEKPSKLVTHGVKDKCWGAGEGLILYTHRCNFRSCKVVIILKTEAVSAAETHCLPDALHGATSQSTVNSPAGEQLQN